MDIMIDYFDIDLDPLLLEKISYIQTYPNLTTPIITIPYLKKYDNRTIHHSNPSFLSCPSHSNQSNSSNLPLCCAVLTGFSTFTTPNFLIRSNKTNNLSASSSFSSSVIKLKSGVLSSSNFCPVIGFTSSRPSVLVSRDGPLAVPDPFPLEFGWPIEFWICSGTGMPWL